MLTRKMLLDEEGIHRCVWIHAERYKCHLSDLLCHHCMIDSLVGVLAPGEWAMVLHQYSWSVDGVDVVAAETLNDYYASLFLIFGHLSLHHVVGAGNAVMEIVGMSGTYAGDVLACLCPSGGICGVGVYDTTQFWEGTIQNKVGRGVGRGSTGVLILFFSSDFLGKFQSNMIK